MDEEMKVQSTENGTIPPFLIHESVSLPGNMLVVPLNWNEEIELLYFKSGHFHLQISLKDYMVEEECIFFVNPGELRRLEALSEGAVEYSIRFNMAMLQFLHTDKAAERILLPLLREELCFPRRVSISDLGNAAVMDLMTQVLCRFHKLGERYPSVRGSELLRLSGAFDELLLKAELLELIGILDSYGLLKEKKPESNGRQVQLIKTAIGYIREQYREKLHIRDLAEQVHLNEEYFIRFFKRAMGIPPMDYVNRYRVQQAKTGLLESSARVYEVAEDSGFRNMGSFIRYFRRVVGMTPTRFREIQREQDEKQKAKE